MSSGGPYFDNMHFAGAPYSYTAEDSNSQTLYDVHMPDPILDETLKSESECQKKAESLLAYYSDKVTTLNIRTFGDNGFKPGYRQYVYLPNEGVSERFRILEVRHSLEDVYWQTELLLSNEPVMMDYVFRQLFQAQKTAQKNQ